jgi:flavin-dependent dehydrogenase
VYLALRSGELAADTILDARVDGDFRAERFTAYSERMCKEIEGMRALVYVFYDKNFSFGKLVKSNPELRGDLTDCLIGNLDKDFTRLFEAVESQAVIPPRLRHGRPLLAGV